MSLKGGLDRFLSRLQFRNALNFRILPQMRPQITPVKRVEILRLSMLYGHASIIVACPHRRTMFEGILVLSLSTLYDQYF